MKLLVAALGLMFLSLPTFAGEWEDGYQSGYTDGFKSGQNNCSGGHEMHKCNLRANGVDNWSDWQNSFEEAEQQAFDRCLANPRATRNWCEVFRSDVKCVKK